MRERYLIVMRFPDIVDPLFLRQVDVGSLPHERCGLSTFQDRATIYSTMRDAGRVARAVARRYPDATVTVWPEHDPFHTAPAVLTVAPRRR